MESNTFNPKTCQYQSNINCANRKPPISKRKPQYFPIKLQNIPVSPQTEIGLCAHLSKKDSKPNYLKGIIWKKNIKKMLKETKNNNQFVIYGKHGQISSTMQKQSKKWIDPREFNANYVHNLQEEVQVPLTPYEHGRILSCSEKLQLSAKREEEIWPLADSIYTHVEFIPRTTKKKKSDEIMNKLNKKKMVLLTQTLEKLKNSN